MTDLEFLKELQKELKTQDHDSQAAPRFWVIKDYEYHIAQEGYHDRVDVCDVNSGVIYELEEYARQLVEMADFTDFYGVESVEDLKAILLKSLLGDDNEEDLIEWMKNNWDGRANIYYVDEVEVIKENTMFLTKQEAKDHIKTNWYHYSDKAHTYAMTAWRAPKVERLLRILEGFDWDQVQIKE